MSSRHDPAYKDSEEKRDAEAEAYLKQLAAKKEAKNKEARGARTAAAAAAKRVPKPSEDRTVIAEKYLKVMEKQALDKHAPAAKRQDRNALAERYLEEMKKKSAGKAAPKGSRHNRRYLESEHARDKQAAIDMALLRKDQALVDKGGKVEKVRLTKAAVRGVDKLKKERQQLTRPHTDRTKVAQQDLAKIKPLLHKFIKTHVGDFFHAAKIPKALLKPAREHLTTKAERDLKQLQHLEKHPSRRQAADRNVQALLDLKKLEAKTGKVPTATVGSGKQRLDVDALAQKDLQMLPKVAKPADMAAAATPPAKVAKPAAKAAPATAK